MDGLTSEQCSQADIKVSIDEAAAHQAHTSGITGANYTGVPGNKSHTSGEVHGESVGNGEVTQSANTFEATVAIPEDIDTHPEEVTDKRTSSHLECDRSGAGDEDDCREPIKSDAGPQAWVAEDKLAIENQAMEEVQKDSAPGSPTQQSCITDSTEMSALSTVSDTNAAPNTEPVDVDPGAASMDTGPESAGMHEPSHQQPENGSVTILNEQESSPGGADGSDMTPDTPKSQDDGPSSETGSDEKMEGTTTQSENQEAEAEDIPVYSMSSCLPSHSGVSMATDPVAGSSGLKRTVTCESGSSFSHASSMDDHTCRICWMGEDKESCIRPCHCSGSSAWVHPNCLRKWLQVANDYQCEICQHKYETKCRMKPFKEWRWRPEKSRALSQLEATLILLGIVTPPLICGIILCTQKVIQYIDTPDHAWKIAALMTLVMASAGTYFAALIYFCRKFCAVAKVWLARNRQTMVHVGGVEVLVEMEDPALQEVPPNNNGGTARHPPVQEVTSNSGVDITEAAIWSIT